MRETYDLRIQQGSGYVLELAYEEDDGTPIDLDGFTAEMHIRRRYESELTLVELANGAGIILGPDGEIAVSLSASETAALPASVREPIGVYDIELTQGGVVTRLLSGKVYVSPEVTHA